MHKEIKVLIVDDNVAMRTLLKKALTRWGYLVVEADNGEAAWDVISGLNPPRLLVLDWMMPMLDGLALCKRIRSTLPFYPYIIFLTQLGGATHIIQGLEAGADEFLMKPVNFTELHARLFAGEKILEYIFLLEEKNNQLLASIRYITILEKLLLESKSK